MKAHGKQVRKSWRGFTKRQLVGAADLIRTLAAEKGVAIATWGDLLTWYDAYGARHGFNGRALMESRMTRFGFKPTAEIPALSLASPAWKPAD